MEVQKVDVQWNGDNSQATLRVQDVRLHRTNAHSACVGTVLQTSDKGAPHNPWQSAPPPEVPIDAYEAKCMACPWHERRTWHDGSSWWWCTLCDCWSAESHITCRRHISKEKEKAAHAAPQAMEQGGEGPREATVGSSA